MSDEELDALVEKLASQIGDDVAVIFNHEYLFKQSRIAITALRAQLAEFEEMLDAAEKSNRISDNGNMWRFWADKAREMAVRLDAANDRIEALTGQLAAAQHDAKAEAMLMLSELAQTVGDNAVEILLRNEPDANELRRQMHRQAYSAPIRRMIPKEGA